MAAGTIVISFANCFAMARASSVFGPCPGLTAMMCPLSRRPKSAMSPTMSRILCRTNSSGKRSGSLLSTDSPRITIALSSDPPLISPLSISGFTSS